MSTVFDRMPQDPDARAEEVVSERLQDGPALLRELDHEVSMPTGETFAAALRLSRNGRVAITPLGGGEFEFELQSRGQVHPIAYVFLIFTVVVLLAGAMLLFGGVLA